MYAWHTTYVICLYVNLVKHMHWDGFDMLEEVWYGNFIAFMVISLQICIWQLNYKFMSDIPRHNGVIGWIQLLLSYLVWLVGRSLCLADGGRICSDMICNSIIWYFVLINVFGIMTFDMIYVHKNMIFWSSKYYGNMIFWSSKYFGNIIFWFDVCFW